MKIIRQFVLPAHFVVTVMLLTPTNGLAKGGYVRPPPIHDLADLPHMSDQSGSSASRGEIFGGCGTHRYYDPKSEMCHGPADD
jgi:hypothetical protein